MIQTMLSEEPLDIDPLFKMPSQSMESLDDLLATASAVMFPTALSDSEAFSSLETLPSVCEPTPIDCENAVFVQEVPLVNSFRQQDKILLLNLKMLIQETSVVNKIMSLHKDNSSSFKTSNKVKRNRNETSPPSEEAFRMRSFHTGLQSDAKTKRQRLVDPSNDTGTNSSTCENDDSGFRNSHVEQWNQKYQELVSFQKEFQHCLVPLNWERSPSLAHWVKRQRYQFRIKAEGKHSTLTAERQVALEKLDFVWDSHAVAWEERLRELYEFKGRYGHTRVPKEFPENPQLAVWVKCQRRQFKLYSERKSSNMTQERIKRLSALGFVFNPRMKPSNTFSF